MRRTTLAGSLAALVAVPALAQPVRKDAPLVAPSGPTSATPSTTLLTPLLDSTALDAFRWRPIGPTNMGGRVADIAGIPSPSKTFYIAAAGGGIWKTTNNGTTFQPVFDRERCASMGSIAIAPSDTNVVYVGTGEQNSRNSISPGCGLYKSTNGGRSWTMIGLPKSEHIARIVVDPRDAKVAYVAALGPAWRSGGERGLYKTIDGGTTWTVSKSINDKTGFIDVALDPSNPDVVWASSYERSRGPYFLQSGGPGSALWKSSDAGKTWTQVKGGGLPETTLGRVNIAIARSNPKVMYAMIEADTAPNPSLRSGQAPTKGKPAAKSPSGLYRSEDGGATWARTNSENTRPFYYNQVRVDPKDANRVYWSSTPVKVSDDGGKTARNATVGIHVDHHAQWIDPNDPARFVVGNDGGVAITYDRGGNYTFLNTIPLAQFYNVSFDYAIPYNVCGGLQDNGSWCGPSRRKSGGVTSAMWARTGGGDGFHTAQDASDPNTVYVESQGGAMQRVDMLSGDAVSLVKPTWRSLYMQWEDSVLVERPDTTAPMSAAQKKRLSDFRTRQKLDSTDYDLRWNWNTPFFLSPHNAKVFYAGSNRVVKSTDRGNNLYFVSPDLSYKDPVKIDISTKKTGGITLDATGAETFATIVSLAESPVKAGQLLVGTDDGRVWVTRNDGAQWEELTSRFAGVPAGSYVSRVEPGQKDTNVFYVTFDNHRRGDFAPYVYMTRDGGRTFKSIASNLPNGGPDFVYVIREDPYNENLLFVGTDVGIYVSLDRGGMWQKFMAGLPTVPVMDLKIHPRDRELIAGTHGRAIWVTDIAPLEGLTIAALAQPTTVFTPKVTYQYGERPFEGQDAGQAVWRAPVPVYGAEIAYRIAPNANLTSPVRVAILGPLGDTLRAFNNAPNTPGVHRILWDMRGAPAPATPLSPAARRDSIVQLQRTIAAIDSLVKEGAVPAQMGDRIKGAVTGGPAAMQAFITQMGAAFGGGGGPAGPTARGTAPAVGYPRFVERPGESAAQGGGGAQREAGGEGAAPSAADQGALQTVFNVLRRSGGGFGGGGRGAAGLVPTGTYQVAVTIDGKTTKVPLRIERVSGGDGTGGFFGTDDSHD